MSEPWTPGPWRFEKDSYRHSMGVSADLPDGTVFELSGTARSAEAESMMEANFRLISVAPELAKFIAWSMGDAPSDSWEAWHEEGLALLARARGET